MACFTSMKKDIGLGRLCSSRKLVNYPLQATLYDINIFQRDYLPKKTKGSSWQTCDISQIPLRSIYVGLSPLPVRVTTRIITFLVGNPYKPSFPLLLGGGTTQYLRHSQHRKISSFIWSSIQQQVETSGAGNCFFITRFWVGIHLFKYTDMKF